MEPRPAKLMISLPSECLAYMMSSYTPLPIFNYFGPPTMATEYGLLSVWPSLKLWYKQQPAGYWVNLSSKTSSFLPAQCTHSTIKFQIENLRISSFLSNLAKSTHQPNPIYFFSQNHLREQQNNWSIRIKFEIKRKKPKTIETEKQKLIIVSDPLFESLALYL